MVEEIKIRKYNDNDYQSMYDLHIKAMQKIGAYKGDGPWDNDLKDIQNNYFNNKGFFYIAELNNEIIGMGAFRKIDYKTAEIKRMRVSPGYQGRGIGKMILDKLIVKAKEYGYKKLMLETSDKQIAANKLYMKSGFVEMKKELIDGFNCTWYEREV